MAVVVQTWPPGSPGRSGSPFSRPWLVDLTLYPQGLTVPKGTWMITCSPGAWVTFRVNLSLAVVEQDTPPLLTSTPPVSPLPMWSQQQCWPSPPSCCPPGCSCSRCRPQWSNPCCPPPTACPPWWWWYQWCWPDWDGDGDGDMFPLNLSFTVNWTTPTNLILGAVIPAGMWVYVGPTTGAVNVAVAHASAGVTTAAFIFSDGTMTATVAGIIYPIAAMATSTVAIGAQQQTRQWSTRSMPRGMPMRSLGAAATPQHMLDALDEDAGDWMVDQTVVGPGQSGTVFSDGWNVRVCGNGKAMLIKVA